MDSLLSSSSKYSSNPAVDFIAKLRTAQLALSLLYRRRIKKWSYKAIICCILTSTLVYLQLTSGIFQRCFLERNFSSGFSYPQDVENFQDVIQRCVYVEHNGYPRGAHPSPINTRYANVAFLHSADGISPNEPIGLLIIVKSATSNFKKRMAIRRTWGDSQYLKDHVIKPELATKMVFICGTPKESHNISGIFSDEKQYGDIVLAQFQDSYENNTYKTVLAMRWAVDYIRNFKYLMIVDDDMYIDLANVIAFMNQIPTTNVQAVTSDDSGVTVFYPVNQLKDVCSSNLNIPLAGKPLLMGQLIVDAKPFRSTFGYGSKWSMSIDEYPFNYFPPYIAEWLKDEEHVSYAGGATLFDNNAVNLLYCGSFFTKHFWVDDVYIGIIAHKLGITLTNNNLMDSSYKLFHRQMSSENFHDMIAVHGLQCPEQLLEVWKFRNNRSTESLKSCYYLSGTL